MDLNLNLNLNNLNNQIMKPLSVVDKSNNLNSYLNEYNNNIINNNNINNEQSFLATSRSSNTTTCTTANTTINNISTSNDPTVSLSTKIKYLEDELSNAQADKEFVWSLWRQLQTANPDVTSAISLVVQREKDKSEIKDRKVLEILKIKDRKLEEYEENVSIKQIEINKLIEKLNSLEAQAQMKEDELSFLRLNRKTFEDKEQMYEQLLRLRDDKLEKTVKDTESEKSHLVIRLKEVTAENECLKEEKSILKLELEQNKEKILVLNKQIAVANDNYEKLLNELNQFRLSIDQCLKSENDKLKSEIKTKNEQHENLKKEFEILFSKLKSNMDYMEQQEKLIKQLKQMQIDLQNTIKNQKNTYQVFESENITLKQMYEQISKKYEENFDVEREKLKQANLAEIKTLKSNDKSQKELIKAQKYEIEKLKLQVDLQLEQINHKQLVCDELNKKIHENEPKDTTIDNKFKREIKLTSSMKNNSAKTLRRSKSVTCNYRSNIRNFKIESSNLNSYSDNEISDSKNKLADSEVDNEVGETNSKIKNFYENLCKAKDKELITLRNAHQRRLERLLSLEKENCLLKEQLDSYIEKEELKMDNYENKKNSDKEIGKFKGKFNRIRSYGYIRQDNELLLKEIKLLRQENENLEEENFNLKEKIDLLNVKSAEQSERIENLRFDLNVNLKDRENEFCIKQEKAERDIKEKRNKIIHLNSEISSLKSKLSDLESKCSNLTYDRIKYVNLSTKLTNENKKLYKKWFQLRKNENKFRQILSSQINKYCQLSKSPKSKESSRESSFANQFQIWTQNEINSKKNKNLPFVASESQTKKSALIQLKAKNLKILSFKKQIDELTKSKSELEQKTDKLNSANQKLEKEIQSFENKLKHSKTQNENLQNEINNCKRKELESKEKEDQIRKHEESIRDEMKKSYEQKLKQLGIDLSKQIGANRNLKTDNEKLNDKLKVIEEKLNHIERDNTQKKQLIDFYKKKLEEINTRNDPIGNYDSEQIINDLKQQLKKSTDINEKLKLEIKSVKSRIQSVQNEKLSLEQKLDKCEKSNYEFKDKLDTIKKEKSKFEHQLKESLKKNFDLEKLVQELEITAETKIKDLSETSHQTLEVAQLRLNYAFKLVDNFECLIKNLYESLINRSIELCKAIRNEKVQIDKIKKPKLKGENENENMKLALNLASSVLNMTTNELDDLLSLSTLNEPELNEELNLPNTDDDNYCKKLKAKFLFEFEQCLNSSKKEKQAMSALTNSNKMPYTIVDFLNTEQICELISKRLNDVLIYERELVCLKNIQN